MNEIIKQLAYNANIEFTYDPTEIPMRVFAECWEDELEKFAEFLIEKVCYDIMNVHGASREHVVLVAKHYGVEL